MPNPREQEAPSCWKIPRIHESYRVKNLASQPASCRSQRAHQGKCSPRMIRAGAEASLKFPPYAKRLIACLTNVTGHASACSRQVQRRMDFNFRGSATAAETLDKIAAMSWAAF
jgi:hypothetical protein